jgi:hypothetical protein
MSAAASVVRMLAVHSVQKQYVGICRFVLCNNYNFLLNMYFDPCILFLQLSS